MTTQGLAPPSTRSEPTNARRRWRKLFSNKLHVFTVSLFLGLILVAIFADLIAPYGAVEVVGVPMGIISGYFGGKTDTIMMRTTDGLLAFPPIILAMATVAALGPNLRNTIIAIGVVQIPRFARLIRGQTLVLREAEFVVAARAIGGSHRYIMSTALLSNLMSLIFVQFTLTFCNRRAHRGRSQLPRTWCAASAPFLGWHARHRENSSRAQSLDRSWRWKRHLPDGPRVHAARRYIERYAQTVLRRRWAEVQARWESSRHRSTEDKCRI